MISEAAYVLALFVPLAALLALSTAMAIRNEVTERRRYHRALRRVIELLEYENFMLRERVSRVQHDRPHRCGDGDAATKDVAAQ